MKRTDIRMSLHLIIHLILLHAVSSQNIQLSYANPELGHILIRSTHATPNNNPNDRSILITSTLHPITTTSTKKPESSGYLNGSFIRSIFTRNGGTSTTAAPVPAQSITHNSHRSQQNILMGPSGSILPNSYRNGFAPQQHHQQPQQQHLQQQFTYTTPRVSTTTPAFSYRNALAQNLPSASVIATTTTTTGRPRTSTTYRYEPTTSQSPSRGSPPRVHTGSSTTRRSYGHSHTTKKSSFTGTVTRDELEELTETLFERSTPNIFPSIHVNLQGKTHSFAENDFAPEPLLTMDKSILESTETLRKMRNLFDNYEVDASVNEYVSPKERIEEMEFVNAILATQVMQTAMQFLKTKQIVTSDPKTHYDLLKSLWFTQYSRISGKVGSSAFEHVFMNEIKNGTIGGLHGWTWFYHKESEPGIKHSIDYQGYMKSLTLGNKGQYVKYRMNYDDIRKPVNAIVIGLLPELEMALYTVCFELDQRECPISLGGTKLSIKTFPIRYRGKKYIGSAFVV